MLYIITFSMQLHIKSNIFHSIYTCIHIFICFMVLSFFDIFNNLHVTCNLNKKLYMIAIFMCCIPLCTPCNYSSNPIYYIEFTIASIFFFVGVNQDRLLVIPLMNLLVFIKYIIVAKVAVECCLRLKE